MACIMYIIDAGSLHHTSQCILCLFILASNSQLSSAALACYFSLLPETISGVMDVTMKAHSLAISQTFEDLSGLLELIQSCKAS